MSEQINAPAKSKLYTKKGDTGKTDLVDGTRIEKSAPRVEIYGELDELNSFIGWALSHANKQLKGTQFDSHIEQLISIQNSLFVLESLIACQPQNIERLNLPQLHEEEIVSIEGHIDQADSLTPKLKHFVLPGGDELSSRFHLCRTVCRRVERKMVAFTVIHGETSLPTLSIKYVNRLSDYLFSLARLANFLNHVADIPWKGR